MNENEFNGEIYHDDRMYVLYVSKCTVSINDDVEATTIYHEEAPENYKWCVVTYRNVARYPPTRVDCFDSEEEAIAYMQKVEPQVPLISLGCKPPRILLPYDQFVSWKEKNQFKEYDYKKMYGDMLKRPGASDPQETLYRQI